MSDAETYFRKGFGLKAAIAPQLEADYASRIVDVVRARGYTLEVGRLVFRLAREFGFCYGVDRAVEYAYETRTKFPDRRLLLVGEIIHNPHVNRRMEEMGITFLRHGPDGAFDFSGIGSEDVVILPAFGVTVQDFNRLRALGCILVDTTCGSVLNVWKRVESYARDGFTAVIHGKYWHEETRATASQVTKYPGGKYLVLLDMAEARVVMDFIEHGGDAAALQARFARQCSPGFDFTRDLERVGFANQTTMLAGESLAIAEAFRQAVARRYGPEAAAQRVRSFDTICSATQERQDAVIQLLEERPDIMVVIGGYNSSNTNHLASLCVQRGVPTYHIEDASGIEPADGGIRHKPVGGREEVRTGPEWLDGVRRIGITAGASTPNNKIGEAVARICAAAGVDLEPILR
jgi:4-hydroxy-3-methylbut-2-enyl diphosphate reductase